jgi:hypothetical protein
MISDKVHFPRPSDGKKLVAFEWTLVRQRNVISVLKNPFYAGAYAYGKADNDASPTSRRFHPCILVWLEDDIDHRRIGIPMWSDFHIDPFSEVFHSWI